MLNQFFIDWNAALQSRKVVHDTRNTKGIIIAQKTEFKFRNLTIEMYARMRQEDENKPERQRRWVSELFVPATNKIIPSTVFPTRAKCAAAILACLVEGRDHEDRLRERAERRKAMFVENIARTRRERLSKTTFTPEDIDFILKWIDENTLENRLSWNDTLIDVLCRYDRYITGVGLDTITALKESNPKIHQHRLFNTACALISEAIKDRNGVDVLGRKSINHFFLAPKEDISVGVYVVRSALCKINDMCPYSNKMLYVVKFIAAYLAKVFNTTVEAGIVSYKNGKESKHNRIAEREHRGEASTHHSKSVRAYDNAASTPISQSIGDMFGDVLSDVVVVEEQPKKKHHKKKTKAPVTDRQINGIMRVDEHNEEVKKNNAKRVAEQSETQVEEKPEEQPEQVVEPEQPAVVEDKCEVIEESVVASADPEPEVQEPVVEEVPVESAGDEVVAQVGDTSSFGSIADALDAALTPEPTKSAPKKKTTKTKSKTVKRSEKPVAKVTADLVDVDNL